jgi:hypothetical protein
MASTTLPIRNLGSTGVLTDPNPYNLPITGFTSGNNVRFDEGKVRRSPVFRNVKDNLGFDPRAAFGVVPDSGFDTVVMVSDDYVIQEYANNTVLNRSGSITSVSDPRAFTMSSLADVTYINRPDRVPAYRLGGGANFADLPNWDSTWRTAALRPFGDFMLALNVTEGAINYPNRVRFSNLVSANSVPDSWDEADTTKSAGFNDLVQMQTSIVDGAQLGTNFVIYSSTEAMLVEFVGGTFIFNFRKLFGDEGVINQNCIAEADGKHFVFGTADIYVTDGTTRVSICDEKTRNFIFTGLNFANADRCFVQHNKVLDEIMFCYQSGDSNVNFPDTDRCNRAAVYNIRNNSWSFYDLPNVSAGTTANVDTVATYASSTGTYNAVGGSYYDQEDSRNRHTLMVGNIDTANGISSSKLYGLDLSDEGSMAFNVDTEATKPPFVERIGIDLDEIREPLDGYKVVTRMLPQVATRNSTNTTLTVEFGASDLPNNTPTYSTTTTFDIASDYKVDSRAAGRYLSYKFSKSPSDYADFELSGFDLDVTTTGRV